MYFQQFNLSQKCPSQWDSENRYEYFGNIPNYSEVFILLPVLVLEFLADLFGHLGGLEGEREFGGSGGKFF